jgi:L-asparaginase/Glu-tRNA(Gln) amidotransferase subunit D
MYNAMQRAIKGGLRLVQVTNCKYGGVFSEYGGVGGNQSLKELGVLMANDLSAYQAMVVGSLLFLNDHLSKEVNLANYFSNTIRID